MISLDLRNVAEAIRLVHAGKMSLGSLPQLAVCADALADAAAAMEGQPVPAAFRPRAGSNVVLFPARRAG